MIFDKDCYDKSLWMMLNIQDDKKGQITNFISNLPNELLTSIRKAILELNGSDEVGKLKNTNVSGQFELDNGVLYWYNINPFVLGTLDIGYSIYSNNVYERVFELTLVPFKNLFDCVWFDEKWIGNIEYDIQKNVINEEISFISSRNSEYNLVNTPFGYFVICYKNGNSFMDIGVRKINFNNIPKEIFIDDICCKGNINKFVKSRKMR